MACTLRALIVFALVHFSISASAQDYYWYTSQYQNKTFPSPAAACQYYVDQAEIQAATMYQFHDTRLHSTRIDPSKTAARCDIYYVYEQNESAWNYNHPVYPDRWKYDGPIAFRQGDGCSNGVYNETLGQCGPPSDGECKTRSPYTKAVQFVVSEGGIVLNLDPEIKDHCIYEPGNPENCNDNVCTVPMTPVGNDDTSDNSENPDQDIQDYLDELAKKFKCEKTANGSVGCTAAQTNPPDNDPDDKCPPGYSWTGTTCVKTDGNGNQNPGTPGGGTGGNNGGGTGGGDGGSNPGTGGDGGGDGGNNGGSGGGDDGNGGGDPKEKLEKPKAGNFNDANDEWDARLKESKDKFKEKVEKLTTEFKGVLNLNLGEGAGKLPCYQFTITAFVKPVNIDLCTEKYSDPLSYLRYILLAIAGLIAGFVILRK